MNSLKDSHERTIRAVAPRVDIRHVAQRLAGHDGEPAFLRRLAHRRLDNLLSRFDVTLRQHPRTLACWPDQHNLNLAVGSPPPYQSAGRHFMAHRDARLL